MSSVESAAIHASGAEHHDTVGIQAFGFWIYLMSDLILFATLFVTFADLSRSYAGGPTGKEVFDLPYTFGETMFLLVSSATYGLVMIASHYNRKQWVMAGLIITFLLGLGAGGQWPEPKRLFIGVLHLGWHPWHPRFIRPDLDAGNDVAGAHQRTDHAGAIPFAAP
jgi:heme/copper-type cytochrome/quinol oxidase subunit 3